MTEEQQEQLLQQIVETPAGERIRMNCGAADLRSIITDTLSMLDSQAPSRPAEETAADIVREWSEHDMDESYRSGYLESEFGAGYLEERIALALNHTATRMRDACVEKVRVMEIVHEDNCGGPLDCTCGAENARQQIYFELETLALDRVQQEKQS